MTLCDAEVPLFRFPPSSPPPPPFSPPYKVARLCIHIYVYAIDDSIVMIRGLFFGSLVGFYFASPFWVWEGFFFSSLMMMMTSKPKDHQSILAFFFFSSRPFFFSIKFVLSLLWFIIIIVVVRVFLFWGEGGAVGMKMKKVVQGYR